MRATTSSRRLSRRFGASVIAVAAAVLMVLSLAPVASAAAGGWEDLFDTARRVASTNGTKISGGALKLAEGQAQEVGEPDGAVPGEKAVYSMVTVGNDVFTGTGENGHLVRYSAGELYQEAFQGPSHYGVSNSRGMAIDSQEKKVTALAYDGTRYIYGGTAPEGHVFSFDTSDPGRMCHDNETPEVDHPVTSIACFGGLVYAGTESGHIFSYSGSEGGTFSDLGAPAGAGKPTAMAVVGGKLYIGFENSQVWMYDGAFTEVNPDGLDSAVNALTVSGTVLYLGTEDGHLNSYDTATLGPFTDLGSPGSGGAIESLAVRSAVVFAGMQHGHVWSYTGIWADEGTAPNVGDTPVNAMAVSADNVLYGGTGNDVEGSTGRLFRRAVDVYESHGGPAGATAVTGVAYVSKKLYVSKGDTLYTYEGPGDYVSHNAPESGQTITDIDSSPTQGTGMVGLANGDVYRYSDSGFSDPQYFTSATVNSLDHSTSIAYVGLSDGRLMNGFTGAEIAYTPGDSPINDLANKSGGGGAPDGEYAGADDGNLYRVVGAALVAVEDIPSDPTPVNAVAVYGDSVFIGHQSGKIYKYNGSAPTLEATCPDPIISMAPGAQGVVCGTSGNHTYIYDDTLLLHDQGVIPGPGDTAPRALANVNSSIWIGTAAGNLSSHDSSNLGDRGQQVKKQIMIWCMTYDPTPGREAYYAGTYQNAHFLVISPSGEVLDCGRPIDGERELEDIMVTSDATHTVYGATYGGTEEFHNPAGGHLFTFDPTERKFVDKGRPPSDDDNWWVSSLVETAPGTVLGATCNSAAAHTGSLFTYNGAFTNLGNLDALDPPQPGLADEGPRCLTYYDSKIFGGTHDPTNIAQSHVFSCDTGGGGFTSTLSPATGGDNAINKIKAVGADLYCAQNDGYVFSVDPGTLVAGTPFQPVASGTTVLGLANGPDNTLLCGTGQLSPVPGGHLASYDPSLEQTREINVASIAYNQAISCLAVGTVGPDAVEVTYGGTKGNEAAPGDWNAGKLFKVPPYRNTGINTATSTVIDPSVTELTQSFTGQGITALCPAPSGAQEVYVGNVNSGGTATLYRYSVAMDQNIGSWPVPTTGQDRILSLAPGSDGKIYIGTGSSGPENAHLLRLDPLNPVIEDLGGPPGSAAKGIFAITAGPDGKIYLGTGDETGQQGHLYKYDAGTFTLKATVGPDQAGRITSLINYGGKIYGVTSAQPGLGQPATFFRLSTPVTWDGVILGGTESSAASLIIGPGGNLFCGTGPTGKLVEISNPGTTPLFSEKASLAGKGVTAMAGTLDAIYGCAGPEGNLFKWTSAGGFVDKGPLTLDNSGVPAATTDNLGKPYFGTAGDVKLVRYNPTAAFEWGTLTFVATVPPLITTLNVGVRNEANTGWLQENMHTGEALPSGVDPIRLGAVLTTTDTLQTPAMNEWSVTWNKKASVDRLDYPHGEGVYKGEQLAIWGADFGEMATAGKVTFGASAPVDADNWFPNCITVTVPQDATVGDIIVTPTGGDPIAADPTAYNLLSDPHVTSVTPGSGRVGDIITIRGTGFLAARSSEDTVTFNGVAAAGYPTWSDTLIKAQVPGGAATGDLYVSVNAHASNGVPFTVQAGGGPTVRITDPASGAAVKGAVIVNATVQRQGGTAPVELWVDGRKSAADAGAPYSFNWNADAVVDGAHTLTVKATDGFGRTGSASITLYVDHTVPSANTNWYFAEGCTNYGFETWLLIGNPTNVAAKAQVVFMDDAGSKFYKACDLPPNSRTTVNAADVAPGANVSIQVEADKPVVCERAMYWDNRIEGHSTIGTTSLSSQWYFAEGSSDWGFETYVLLCNPSDSKVKATVNYLFPDGTSAAREHDIGPHSRVTVNAVNDVGVRDFSVKVDASAPGIVAERSMYHGGRRCGTGTIGCKAPSLTWFLSEGSTDWGFETWLLIQNPTSKAGRVTASYRKGNGETVVRTYDVKGNSRYTVNLADEVGVADVSTQVASDVPVVCERSMYWNNRSAGHCTIGSPGPGTTWYLAEGCTDYGFETWLLLDNPSDSAVSATLTLMKENGTSVPVGVELKPHSRTSIDASRFVGAASFSTSITATSPIMVERAMYWNGRSGGTDSIGAR